MHLNWGHITRFSFLVFILLIIIPACEDDFNSSIPYTPVNFRVNLVNNNQLTVDGNSLFFGFGYGGVIVTNAGSTYYANDATCPYEIDIQCRVEAEGSAIATCPCCGSTYNLWDGGSVIKGPSSEPLKPYRVSQTGSILIVTN